VVDAQTANGQDKFQTSQELLVSTDHLLFVLIAEQDNLLTDTLAKHAQLDKFKAQQTLKHATLQSVMDNTPSELLLIASHVVDVLLANGHNKFQTHLELPV